MPNQKHSIRNQKTLQKIKKRLLGNQYKTNSEEIMSIPYDIKWESPKLDTGSLAFDRKSVAFDKRSVAFDTKSNGNYRTSIRHRLVSSIRQEINREADTKSS